MSGPDGLLRELFEGPFLKKGSPKPPPKTFSCQHTPQASLGCLLTTRVFWREYERSLFFKKGSLI